MQQEVFAAVTDALERGEPAALVTIVSTTGSTPQRVGAKMLVFGDGRLVGTIGGGCYENDAFWKAREAIKTRKPQTVRYELNDQQSRHDGVRLEEVTRGGLVLDCAGLPADGSPLRRSSSPAAPAGGVLRPSWAAPGRAAPRPPSVLRRGCPACPSPPAR